MYECCHTPNDLGQKAWLFRHRTTQITVDESYRLYRTKLIDVTCGIDAFWIVNLDTIDGIRKFLTDDIIVLWTSDWNKILKANLENFQSMLVSFHGYGVHYSDVIMRAMASQITSVFIVCSTVCSGADQRKHQSSASLDFVRGVHW